MSTPDPAEFAVDRRRATATAQGKVNLYLAVGARRPDGYHDLVTVFQAVDLTETVTATVTGHCTDPADAVTGVSLSAQDVAGTPTGIPSGTDNLAVRGALAVLRNYHRSVPGARLPRLSLDIIKGVPVAGGMAGGSADAAAAMVATREILHGQGAAEAGYSLAPRPSDAELRELAAPLGADVPFCLLGGTALGSGTGAELVPVMSRGVRHWAFAIDRQGLSTPEVFARLDRQREDTPGKDRPVAGGSGGGVTVVQRALLTANSTELAAALSNDLQPAALSLRPELRRTLTLAREAGALAAVVSGSGPTVAMLCSHADHAVDVATAVSAAGHSGPTLVARSSPHGARLVP